MKALNYWIKTILGIILLTPALISVPLFVIRLFYGEVGNIVSLTNLNSKWAGFGEGYTSATPTIHWHQPSVDQ